MFKDVVVIVQARLGSTRLPGKILELLNGFPVLEHVLQRCSHIVGKDAVVCAGVDSPGEQVVRDCVEQWGFGFYAGDELDVLSRFYHIASARSAQWVVRITSDCPLLDPEVCKGLIEHVISSDADYGCTEAWPHGLDCEVMRFSALQRAHAEARLPVDREHVTLWIRNAKDNFRTTVFRPSQPVSSLGMLRWVVDYPEDLQFLQALFKAMNICPRDFPTWREVVSYLQGHSELLDINASRIADWSEVNKAIFEKSKSG